MGAPPSEEAGQSPGQGTAGELTPAEADLHVGADAQRNAFQAVAADLGREGATTSSWELIGSIGAVNNASHRRTLSSSGHDPGTFRADQYRVNYSFPDGHIEQHIVTVFTDGTTYYYPHVSSAN